MPSLKRPKPVAALKRVPIEAYFDATILAQEQLRLFNQAPQSAGHAQMVPQLYDYQVLAQHGDGLVLVHTQTGLRLLSNVCRHRQATILEGRGHARTFTCPLHC
ncbi:MAG: Rieske 2Fe-2S domain-containing protein [Neisseriaceae bacterium]|nr:Rieske 2Fe-2S domain-containing protein [Neisseriaceae bacterium]